MPPDPIVEALKEGQAIPAHPLALTEAGGLDERRQRALTRYYLDAGAGGLAVGVHTTEFAIHRPDVGLYKPVLELAMETALAWKPASRTIMVAGIVGAIDQALSEAALAAGTGYHAGLLSLGALRDSTEEALLEHSRRVAEVIPIMGFYLQPSVGGRILSERFWRGLAEIPNLLAIKIAPFNRYCTLEVIRAVAGAGREDEVALYTGNDDSILVDLLTSYEVDVEGTKHRLAIVGGLLGHWAYWTSRAVEQHRLCRQARGAGTIGADLLTLAAQVTEANEAVFDPDHSFRGCISGILYALVRCGLLEGVHAIGEGERLSPGQTAKIDRIALAYPHLVDDRFVRENLSRWITP
jgi:hypothetical protein